MTKIVDTVFLNSKDIDHKNPQQSSMEGVGDSLLPTLVKPDQAKANSFIILIQIWVGMAFSITPKICRYTLLFWISTKSSFLTFKIRQRAILVIRLFTITLIRSRTVTTQVEVRVRFEILLPFFVLF
jgi:hypothetical protein